MSRKRCSRCHETLPLASFNRDRTKPDGHRYWCRDCQRRWRKAFYGAHQERLKATARAYRAANPQKCDARIKAWREANPERYRELNRFHTAKRRARLADRTVGEAADLRAAYDFIHTTSRLRCYWCREVVPMGERHVDHIIAIAAGGVHAAYNLCCSCPQCNQSKGAKLPGEFAGQGELVFA